MKGIAEDIWIVIHCADCYCKEVQKLHFIGICSLARKPPGCCKPSHLCGFVIKAVSTLCERKDAKTKYVVI